MDPLDPPSLGWWPNGLPDQGVVVCCRTESTARWTAAPPVGCGTPSVRAVPEIGSTSLVAKLGPDATNDRGLPGMGSMSVVAKLGSDATSDRGPPRVGSTSVVA